MGAPLPFLLAEGLCAVVVSAGRRWWQGDLGFRLVLAVGRGERLPKQDLRWWQGYQELLASLLAEDSPPDPVAVGRDSDPSDF